MSGQPVEEPSIADRPNAEAERLERLWSGEFGDAYVERNAAAGEGRADFWSGLLGRHPVTSVLEVGCNLGGNLQHVADHVPSRHVHGIDVNEAALTELRTSWPAVNATWALARELPFRDRWFDLVFTVGVLIHQPDATLGRVVGEMVRCSRRYVLCAEYHAEETEEVPYRGVEGALFRRDYRRIFLERFPELELVDEGHLGEGSGFDDVTWHLFERRTGTA